MVATRAQKKAAVDSAYPLCDLAVLDVVLSFLGCGQGLFITAVSSRWCTSYKRLAALKEPNPSRQHVHLSICTTYNAVFASPSRVRVAHDCGLLYTTDDEVYHKLQRGAGKVADVATLQAAHELDLPYSEAVMQGAVESCSLEKLRWLHLEQRCALAADSTAMAAGAGGIQALRWLLQRGCVLNESTSFRAASRANNLQVLQFLSNAGCPWQVCVTSAAAETGDLQQVQWLLDHGAPRDWRASWGAARGGALHILLWLQQQGFAFDESTMSNAASGNHVHVCEWLRAAQCPWDFTACNSAALNDALDALRWLHSNGCLWDTASLCRCAAIGVRDRTEMLEYLLQEGQFSDPARLSDALNSVGARGKLTAAQWLRHHGAQWPAVLRDTVMIGRPWSAELLAWARAEGCASPSV
jgi:hypothetical protein